MNNPKAAIHTLGVEDGEVNNGTGITAELRVPDFMRTRFGYVAFVEHGSEEWVEFTCDDGGGDILVRIPREHVEAWAARFKEIDKEEDHP